MRRINTVVGFLALAAFAWHLIEVSAINEDLRTHDSGWAVSPFSNSITPDNAETVGTVKRKVLVLAGSDTTEESLNGRARRRFDVYAMLSTYGVLR